MPLYHVVMDHGDDLAVSRARRIVDDYAVGCWVVNEGLSARVTVEAPDSFAAVSIAKPRLEAFQRKLEAIRMSCDVARTDVSFGTADTKLTNGSYLKTEVKV